MKALPEPRPTAGLEGDVVIARPLLGRIAPWVDTADTGVFWELDGIDVGCCRVEGSEVVPRYTLVLFVLIAVR